MEVEISENNKLLEVLKRRGVLTTTLHKMVEGFMEKWEVGVYQAVVETHVIDESRLADILADEFKLPRVSRLRSRQVEPDVLSVLKYTDAMKLSTVAFAIDPDSGLHVAVSDPCCSLGPSALHERGYFQFVTYVAERSEIEVFVQKSYPLIHQFPKTMLHLSSKPLS